MHEKSLQAMENALRCAKRVLVVGHINPDGDTVGSSVALAHIMLRLQGDAHILLASGVPDFLSWLRIPVPIVRGTAELGGWEPDMAVFVDCGDAGRAGFDFADAPDAEIAPFLKKKGIVVANIDHHVSNPRFADINWVEPQRSAAGEMVGILAERLGFDLDGELGEALFLALASDTGNFSYSNTSADCLAMAAHIVAAGLNVAEFTRKYENNWSVARMHLWGKLMSEISLHENGSVACSIVPKRYLDELGLKKEALEGYASWLRKLRGVRVGLFIREDSPDFCKISLRSMGDFDSQAVAALYGGGGHAAAAGAELSRSPDAAAKEVLAQIGKRL
jgi:phosphoesterase RecJ-like protein